ncbi:MAG: anti-sigma factor [Myxococcales bacterium]|nr:zf-HC2 domain-containing protein [Myxococcales bacterium]
MTAEIHHCKECVDLLGEYIEGTLPPDRAKALEDHLSLCPPCITFVRTYKATRKLCHHALVRDMPRELMHSLSSFLAERVPGFKRSEDETVAAPAADSEPKKV